MKYAYIDKNNNLYGVRKMCRVLKVSSSGYYDWKRRPISKREKQDKVFLKEILKIHVESKENYGTIKIWKEFKTNGICCGKNRVARLRKKHGIETF
ncbi:IS3 family transposase [Candidatus Omnitrophota bacterium]